MGNKTLLIDIIDTMECNCNTDLEINSRLYLLKFNKYSC